MMNNDKLLATMFFGALSLTLGATYFWPSMIQTMLWIDLLVLTVFLIGYIFE